VDRDDLLMGLAAGFMIGQVESRSAFPLYAAGGISLIGLVAAIAFGGFVRGLGIVVILLGIIAALSVLLVRAMAKAAIRKFAEPRTIVAQRAAVDAALAEADLPTGPISSLRYIARFRKGLRPELDRLNAIFHRLDDELGLELLAGREQPELEGPDG
jgi:hypothetical protein